MRLKLGDYTKYGTVVAVLWIGERYYTMKADDESISLVPGVLAEQEPPVDHEKCVRVTCA